MAYITTDNLTVIMAEMTDYCNAACPLCQRYDWNLNLSETVNKSIGSASLKSSNKT